MRKLSFLLVAMLAVPFIGSAQSTEAMISSEEAAIASLQEARRPQIRSMASLSWRTEDLLNIRVFMCDGRKITSRQFTGRRDGKNEFDGKWSAPVEFAPNGDNVSACCWVEDNKVNMRVFVGGDDRKITEHIYVGNADVQVGEVDKGTWTIGKTFRGETASVDVTTRRGKSTLNLFTANRNGGRLKFFTQREGRDWKEVELDQDR